MTRLVDMLGAQPAPISEIAAYLDGLDGPQRTSELRTLGSAEQERLFDLAEGHRAMTFEDVVPRAVGPLVGVAHPGKNNLPVFPHFAKVFCRPTKPSANVLFGYNSSGAIPDLFAGPGYFVLRETEVPGELLVDYTQVPSEKPADWPEIAPNERGVVPRLVFGNMGDVLRSVTPHVSVGRAYRRGKPMNNWFVLNRE